MGTEPHPTTLHVRRHPLPHMQNTLQLPQGALVLGIETFQGEQFLLTQEPEPSPAVGTRVFALVRAGNATFTPPAGKSARFIATFTDPGAPGALFEIIGPTSEE